MAAAVLPLVASFDVTAPAADVEPCVQRTDGGPPLEVSPEVLDEIIDLMADALLADVKAAQKKRTRVA